ncbi:TetR/AcrR family transcriptional regulator [Kitasatospora sp. NPDC008050]|uniref:TetR/AcrR family transcriptional regulator n=1 Tax=Kitasatospora sp. NPDC008050 TaxID=3364021 RepID=UPI0036EC4400
MDTAAPSSSGRRSRLTPERADELFTAVLDLVKECGYEAVTMDAVAARTRSSKATLYRQWNGKPQLVAAALRHHKPGDTTGIDTGSLRGDLHELARRTEECAPDTELLAAVSHAILRNPELGAALREYVIEPERAALAAVLDRAEQRGEIRPDAAAREFLMHLLVGVLPARKVIEDRFVDAEFMIRYIDAVALPALRHS